MRQDTITVIQYHNLSLGELKEKIRLYLEHLKLDNAHIVDNMKIKWRGVNGEIRFDVVGLKLTGSIEIEDDSITVISILPPPANVYRDKLENIVKYELTNILA